MLSTVIVIGKHKSPSTSEVTLANIGSLITWILQWHHNERDCASNHGCLHCLLNRLFRRRSKKTLKLSVTGCCEGNSPVTGEFPAQRTSNAENASIWLRHHVIWIPYPTWPLPRGVYARILCHKWIPVPIYCPVGSVCTALIAKWMYCFAKSVSLTPGWH